MDIATIKFRYRSKLSQAEPGTTEQHALHIINRDLETGVLLAQANYTSPLAETRQLVTWRLETFASDDTSGGLDPQYRQEHITVFDEFLQFTQEDNNNASK